jgi:2'-5' RNA ligase
VRAATAEPRRYGFHATLKPPFELHENRDAASLVSALENFAEEQSAFEIPKLKVAALGRFLALVPANPCPRLVAFAGRCVQTFEPFRAPLTSGDRERRLARPLSPRQLAYVDRWGYPYVFEEFRFHMTLTGPLDDAAREPLRAGLAAHYAAIDQPVPVDAVTLCSQHDRSSNFRVVRRFEFRKP